MQSTISKYQVLGIYRSFSKIISIDLFINLISVMNKLEFGLSNRLYEFTYSLLYRNAKNYTIYRSNVNEYIENNSIFVNLNIRFFGSSLEFLISSYSFAFIYFLTKVIYCSAINRYMINLLDIKVNFVILMKKIREFFKQIKIY